MEMLDKTLENYKEFITTRSYEIIRISTTSIIEKVNDKYKDQPFLLNKKQTLRQMRSWFSPSKLRKIYKYHNKGDWEKSFDDVLFSTKSGIICEKNPYNPEYKIYFYDDLKVSEYSVIEFTYNRFSDFSDIQIKGSTLLCGQHIAILLDNDEIIFYKELLHNLRQLFHDYKSERIDFAYQQYAKAKEILESANKVLIPDNHGLLKLKEDGFAALLKANQRQIIDNDEKYVHKFVQISNYLKAKRDSIQYIYKNIEAPYHQRCYGYLVDTHYEQVNSTVINTYFDVDPLVKRYDGLIDQISSYEIILYHAINMLSAFLRKDMILFYEIYEAFDKLNMFNSHYENSMLAEIRNVSKGIDNIVLSINQLESSLTSQLAHLTYTTEESYKMLNETVNTQLKEVNSALKVNNLLTGTQAYQTYRLNNKFN